MSKTLKEIYEYDLIEDDGIDYTVDEWFNTIMAKTKAVAIPNVVVWSWRKEGCADSWIPMTGFHQKP